MTPADLHFFRPGLQKFHQFKLHHYRNRRARSLGLLLLMPVLFAFQGCHVFRSSSVRFYVDCLFLLDRVRRFLDFLESEKSYVVPGGVAVAFQILEQSLVFFVADVAP